MQLQIKGLVLKCIGVSHRVPVWFQVLAEAYTCGAARQWRWRLSLWGGGTRCCRRIWEKSRDRPSAFSGGPRSALRRWKPGVSQHPRSEAERSGRRNWGISVRSWPPRQSRSPHTPDRQIWRGRVVGPCWDAFSSFSLHLYWLREHTQEYGGSLWPSQSQILPGSASITGRGCLSLNTNGEDPGVHQVPKGRRWWPHFWPSWLRRRAGEC